MFRFKIFELFGKYFWKCIVCDISNLFKNFRNNFYYIKIFFFLYLVVYKIRGYKVLCKLLIFFL